jgi:hypothetical protein
MAAASAVGADEVQVVAADLDPLGVGGEAEPDHRPLDVGELEDVLVGHDLRQRPVGRLLPRHRAGADEIETPVDAHGAGGSTDGDQLVETRQQLFVGQLFVRQPLVDSRFEAGHNRERRPLLRRDSADPAVDVGAEELAVDRDHLAVEVVQRPQAEVAVLGQLGKAEVALEGAVEQRSDRRGLEEHVWLVLGVEVGAAHRLHVQRPDPALVQHRRSLPGRPAGDVTAQKVRS